MALSADKSTRVQARPDLSLADMRVVVAAGVTIYTGAMVALNGSGEAIVPTGAERIQGIAQNGGVAGEYVNIQRGQEEQLPFAGATSATVGRFAYATSDNVLSLTPSIAIVGKVMRLATLSTANQVVVLVTLEGPIV